MAAMESRLKHLSDLTQKWLIYAEAKNTALVVGNTFALFKLINTPQDPTELPFLYHVGVLCLALATICAFAAIFPLTKYMKPTRKSSDDCTLNPFSSENLTRHTPRSLLKQLDFEVITHFELEFAEYIIGTGKLILRKYTFFKYGGILTVSGILVLALLKLLH